MTAHVKHIEQLHQFESFNSSSKKKEKSSIPPLSSGKFVNLFEEEKDNNTKKTIIADSSETNIEKSQSSINEKFHEIDVRTSSPKERNLPNCLSLAPPPIPKRTFQGKVFINSKHQPASSTNISPSGGAYNSSIEGKNKKNKSLSEPNSKESCSSRFCSISFDDIGDSDDLVIFDKKNLLIDPNQSSSDSSRSQTTIDTGYISAFENDHPSVPINQRQFRGRFSSEDTQSSLDSYLSSDLQRADTIESLQSNLTDSPFVLKKNANFFSFDQTRLSKKISSSGSIDSDNNRSITPIKTHAMRRLPAVPTRKGIRQRTPPVPPLRASHLAETKLRNDGSQMTMKNNIREDLNSNKTPSLGEINHSKTNQRQDSSISSDSFSLISSPGYHTKNMEVPLLHNASSMNKSRSIVHENSKNYNMSINKSTTDNRIYSSQRQSSSISNDSLSQTSSPGSNPKSLETRLITTHGKKNHRMKNAIKNPDEIVKDQTAENNSSVAIIKSASTPAGLQTIVRFSNGSNMSLQHKIIRVRKNSNPYVTRGKLRFRLCQVLLNALALLIIAAGLAGYFNAYPSVKFVNKTVVAPTEIDVTNISNSNKNPAPGVCLPVIVKFCQNHKLPYNYTVFPNYIGHFGQLEAQVELEQFDALVDVQCYELVPLYLCSLFVPKCSSIGKPVPPCKNLCIETMRRCGFFFDVFGLELPEYLSCKLFSDSVNPDECVGAKEMKALKTRKPVCNEFSCDKKRCIPHRYVCDGVVDCFDQTDEIKCSPCNSSSIHCGERKCMSDRHICDGAVTCPYAQDERNCIRLSSTNGDMGRGTLEVYKANKKRWEPACIRNWIPEESPTKVCSMLGYNSVNSSRLMRRGTNFTIVSNQDPTAWMRISQRKTSNLIRDYVNCNDDKSQIVAELTCTNFECGKIRTRKRRIPKTRIIGGNESNPGDWPFLAAILGGPEEVFYCAGVLIADQWVLTASHCIGNHTLRNSNDWTIQLGMTRRNSHAHYGQKIKIKKVIPHPQYNEVIAHDNDIALFQLATRVAFHDHLLPVCLPPSSMKELVAGTNCTVIGWGKKEDKNSDKNSHHGPIRTAYEPAINEVVVPVLNRELCNEWLDTLNVTEGMICAGYESGGYDACQGDSGGPLLCPYPNERDRWFVGGIVSWGIMCAHPKLPGVYANVVKYIPWILSHINNHTTNKADSFGG